MRVTKYVTVDAEVEVDVKIDDVLAELRASVEDEDTTRTILRGLNDCLQFLQAIQDRHIEGMSDEACELICKNLRAQERRYDRKQQGLPFDQPEG